VNCAKELILRSLHDEWEKTESRRINIHLTYQGKKKGGPFANVKGKLVKRIAGGREVLTKSGEAYKWEKKGERCELN